jgi:2-polyprenyl-6-hydroxyphenyl methylase/3-demethylubiquinone-9 3-methyltransferase
MVRNFPQIVGRANALQRERGLPRRGAAHYDGEVTWEPAKNTICLWYDGDAEDARGLRHLSIRPSARCTAHRRLSVRKKGDVLTVEFTVMAPVPGLNGGPAFKHNEAFVSGRTTDQAETDRCGTHRRQRRPECGWCKDKWASLADYPAGSDG